LQSGHVDSASGLLPIERRHAGAIFVAPAFQPERATIGEYNFTMSNNKSKGDTDRPKVQWTDEQRTRHQAIRDMFRTWHPSPEELIASGEGANFDLTGEYRELRPFVEKLKLAREAAGLTLAEVSRRCGIDHPALSRLETGYNKNPTLDTLWRYAAAVGRRLLLTTEAIRDTRPAVGKAKRPRAARES